MAAIKAYTDLSQSKTLSKILPIESADMCYLQENGQAKTISPSKLNEILNVSKPQVIPCWSLAALLEEIPEVINFDDDESDYTLEILKEHELYYLSYGNPLENSKIEIEPQENFVDACVDMIDKLHELKML